MAIRGYDLPHRRGIVIGLIPVATIALAAPAIAADRPGTPDQERIVLIGPDRARLSWHSTVRPSPGLFGQAPFVAAGWQPDDLTTEIEGQVDPSLPSARYSLDGANRASVVLSGLMPGRHCFRVWTRLGDYRAEQPTAWACLDIRDERKPYVLNSPAPPMGMVVPNYARNTLWLRALPGGDLRRVTDGFVKFVRSGTGCGGSPWRGVAYQYGGWPGLGVAGYTTRQDAYAICWASEPTPSAPEPAPPIRSPLPAPPVRRR